MPETRTFFIGRDRNCDLVLPDDSVSRIHAELTFVSETTVLISDRNSSNGTFVSQGGEVTRVHQVYLQPQDEVRFGAATYRVCDLIEAIRKRFYSTPEPITALPERSYASTLQVPAADQTLPPAFGFQAGGSHAPQMIRCLCGALRTIGEPCKQCGYAG